MLSIILSILKVIGIVLLVILLVALLLILLVLFVPIRYSADAVTEEKVLDSDDADFTKGVLASFSFGWLFRILNGGISYPDRPYFRVRLFCFELFNTKSDDKENVAKNDEKINEDESMASRDDETSKEENIKAEAEENATIEQNKEPEAEEEALEVSVSEEKSDTDVSSKDSIEEDSDKTDNCENEDSGQTFEDDFEEESGNIHGFFEFLSHIIEKIQSFIEIQQNVFDKLKCTISRVYVKINMIKNTLESEIFHRAFEKAKKHLRIILKTILPRKINADILYGTGDPALTAEIMAGLGVLQGLGIKGIKLTPDFDRTVIAGDIHVKGRITIFRIVLSLLICYFNKDIRKIIKRFKKIINN